MIPPISSTSPLPADQWAAVRSRAIFDCCKWDVQSEDHCVLARFPLLIDAADWQTLATAAERLAVEALAAERELFHRPELHQILGLPRTILRQLAHRDRFEPPAEACRVMRFDFHHTSDGWRLSEVNADVPGGFIEAGGFTRLVAQYLGCGTAPPDPASVYAAAISERVGTGGLVALVHATAYSDDRQVMQYLAAQLAKHGVRSILVSPAHLRWNSGRARIECSFASETPDLVVRFFPGEWLPELQPRVCWINYFHSSLTFQSNPATALLIQSKRFPIAWNYLQTPLPTWRTFLPETICPSQLPRNWRGEWVLKPVFGRVGRDVGIAGITQENELATIARSAKRSPTEWAAQRQFDLLPIATPDGTRFPSIGVFTVNGAASGLYGRLARKRLIDHEAQDAAVLIRGARPEAS